MEPLLDKLARVTAPEKVRRKLRIIFRSIGVLMFILPSLYFMVGMANGYNVIDPPTIRAPQTNFDPAPEMPTATIIIISISAFSPFFLIAYSERHCAANMLMIMGIWGVLVVQLFILMVWGNLTFGHFKFG